MKCLHILPMNKLSGAEKMALLICKNMKEYTPIVVCGGLELKRVFEKEGIKSYSLSFANKIGTLIGLKNIIKENNIKILHAHDNNASLNAYLVKKVYGLDVKVVSHIHNCYPFLVEKSINKYVDRVLRPKYDYNVACSSMVFDFYKENAKYFNEEKTTILPNSIDIDYIKTVNSNDVSKLKDIYNISENNIVLGFIGRLEQQKGIIPFIKEISKRKDEFKNYKVLVVGSGQQEHEVKKLIKELKLDELFILTGFQEDIYKFYPLIDIFFLPSLYEGLPMALLEAMAFKNIVVSMDVGGIKEIIKNNETGFLVQKNNYKEFISTLLNVSRMNNELIKRNAFNKIDLNFNINKYNSKLNNIYNILN